MSLLVAPMIALGETGDVGRRSGMYMSVLASGALAGPPISGAINGATNGYAAVGVYAGEFRARFPTDQTLTVCGTPLRAPSTLNYKSQSYRTTCT